MMLEEYKKFMFSCYNGSKHRIGLTPSDLVDLIWHYHIHHTCEYIMFSNNVMEKPFFHHIPCEGTNEENITYYQYSINIQNLITKYYGEYNKSVWAPNELYENSGYVVYKVI